MLTLGALFSLLCKSVPHEGKDSGGACSDATKGACRMKHEKKFRSWKSVW